METIIETFNVYTFEEASKELRDKIRYEIDRNWNLYEHHMQERIETLKCVADYLQCDLDYSLSCVPSRGEYIKLSPKNYNSIEENLPDLLEIKESCPFTGVCYDDDIIDDIKEHGIDTALNKYIKSIHDEYEYMLTDEYLLEHCEANDYKFKENGELYQWT